MKRNAERPDPVLGTEITPLTFGVTATPGADSDPITLYQWDFDGDNIFEENTEAPSVVWQFMEPGLYNVGVLVRDRDSFTFRTQLVDVKPVTFETILHYAKYRLDEVFAEGNLSIINRTRLSNTGAAIDRGIWGQRYDELSVNPVSEYAEGELNNPTPARGERAHIRAKAFLRH